MPNTPSQGRVYAMDWLRIGAFALLIFYHAGRAYFPNDPWHVNDALTSQILNDVLQAIAKWRLPLLFFVSGFGTFFILSRRNLVSAALNRLGRLGIPLLFAMALIVPPQVYIERLVSGAFTGSYLAFMAGPAWTRGTYPTGNISWHHLWYVAYLLVISLVLLPVFFWLYRRFEGRTLPHNGQFCVLLAGVVPCICVVTFWQIWPGKSLGLLGDWGYVTVCAAFVLLGFVSALFRRQVLPWAMDLRWLSLCLVLVFYVAAHLTTDGSFIERCVGVLLAWTAILALAGFAMRYLNRDHPWRAPLNTAIFPVYIIHQTVTVFLAWQLLDSALPPMAKFGLVAMGTFAISCGLYVLVIRRLGRFKVLFGA